MIRLALHIQSPCWASLYAEPALITELFFYRRIRRDRGFGKNDCEDYACSILRVYDQVVTAENTQSGRDGSVEIVISNPVAPGVNGELHGGNRLALENIRQRLQITFGERAGLVSTQVDGEYRVLMRFPETGVS